MSGKMTSGKIIDPNQLEKQIHREIPSQIPVHTDKASWNRMIEHCITAHDGKSLPIWACKKNGARVKARMVMMKILDRDTGLQLDYAPVATLFCSGCDTEPNTHGGDTIFKDQVQTLAM
jgi:hypothetical protein